MPARKKTPKSITPAAPVSRDPRLRDLETRIRELTARVKGIDPIGGRDASRSFTDIWLPPVDDGLTKQAKARRDHSQGGKTAAEKRREANIARDNAIWDDYQMMARAGIAPRFIAGKLEIKYAGTAKDLTARRIRTILANKKGGK